MKLTLVSPYGVSKEVKTGWSWTTFFFGVFVPLFRGDFKWAGIMFAINLLLVFVTAGFGNFVTIFLFAAIYNKVYIKDLVNKGYKGSTDNQEETLRSYIVA